jgi:SpoVK/Ycf46/Vps4 family AAA+-type ATPase
MSAKPNIAAQRANPFDDIKKLIASKYPIVWIESWEEDRVESTLKKVAEKGFTNGLTFSSWSQTQGASENKDIIQVLQDYANSPEKGVLLIKDFNFELAPVQMLKRSLRDVFHKTKGAFKTLFLVSPYSDIPDDMLKDIVTMDFALPNEDELEGIFQTVLKAFPKVKNSLNQEQKGRLLKGALGLTSDEAKLTFQKMLVGRNELNEAALITVYEEKARIIKRDGLLEFVPTKYALDDIGGLENLKNWLHDRSSFFSEEAQKAGLQMPKGLLMTGVSGCGKSLCTQAIAAAWGLPLYRLDINRVYGGALGTPEEGFRRAIKQVESVAPAILWLEEVEKSVAGYQQGDRGVTARIFSSFLTWMQEHTTPVFVAATANEIDKLPAELLRKGRFDEIFFVDLPTEKERAQIYEVHLKKRNVDISKFNLNELAKASHDFNGAEIEQAVIAGLVFAYKENKRPLKQEDIFKAIGTTVPLATTMAESIKEIKRWADTRAVKASKG